MRRLDRYILAEILGPLALGFLTYTFMLLIQVLFKSAKLIIGSGVSIDSILRLLALSMPSIVVLTIPASLLFAILIGVGRLSSDSELIAIRASGVSLFSLYRPILLLSALLTGFGTYLMLEVLPDGNRALESLQVEILTRSLTEEIEPRVPHTGWQNKVLYVFESPPNERRWHGTVLADAVPGKENQIVVARWGRALADEGSDDVLLELQDTFTHWVNLDKPETYRAAAQKEYTIRLSSLVSEADSSGRKGLRSMKLNELRAIADDPAESEIRRNIARTEIHKKFGLPFACMVFGLLGLPLGFKNSRGGKSSGFALSIGVIMIYYVIFNSGEEAARDGSVEPWLAVWLPNALMIAAGIFLLARRNRDKSLLLQGLDRWIQERFWSKLLVVRSSRERKRDARRQRQRESRRSANLVLRLPELRLRFPNSMDRYILRTFFSVLLVAGLSGIAIYLIADVTDIVEDILENEISRDVVFDYYKYKCFAIAYEISPIIVLITTLMTFGLLSRSNEITACKALGISLYRMAVPVLLAATMLAGLAAVVESEVLPAANSEVAALKAKIKGDESLYRARQRADRQWLYGQDNSLFNYSHYDAERKTLQNLQIFRFDDEYQLVGRLMAERATHIEGPWWTFSKGWARTFNGQELTGFSTFEEPVKYRLPEAPEYFAGGTTPPEEMDYIELRAYINDLLSSGQKVPDLIVALHNKIAYPVISLVMALVALPFAFRLGRQGALYGIGLSLVLGIVLLIVLSVFRALGENAILPPAIAVWSPSLLFSTFSLYLFLGVRS